MQEHLSIGEPRGAAPGLVRRFAGIFYDCLVLGGLLIVAAAVVIVPLGKFYGVEIESGNLAYQIYLSGVIFGFFGWFWVHGGQTPGMRAWRIRLVRENGDSIRWRDALVRFLSAILSWVPLGLGFLWALFDADRLAWHDRLSHTRLVSVNPAHH